jgi:ubiquinone/menaquinone biosynthesis C-methylase UbiE
MDLTQQQIDYYRARAGEYDQWFNREGRYDRGPELNQLWRAEAQQVRDALAEFQPRGDLLELACGTGIWTEQLARSASTLTAVDASPEVLAINKNRVNSPSVTYIEADLFSWEPPREFDAVFFSFWLSHVPPERFEAFWVMVRRALRPGGRFFFIDSRHDSTSTAKDHQLPAPAATTLTRRLNDGREFQIYKVFYDAAELQTRLRALGFEAEVLKTGTYFIYGQGARPK